MITVGSVISGTPVSKLLKQPDEIVGSVISGTPVSKLLKQPDEIGGAETQIPYLVVSDIDSIYASAKIAGATMVIDLAEKEHGGKAFTCSDPEGHVWSVGTYDPWEAQPA